MPHESYPRYSSFFSPDSTNCGASSWAPTYPNIPHMAGGAPLNKAERRRFVERTQGQRHRAPPRNRGTWSRARWDGVVGQLPAVFVPPMTTVPSRGSPAECFEIPFLVTHSEGACAARRKLNGPGATC